MTKKSQLELNIHTPKKKDRNHHSGGRSFYFFDFDDNVIHLPTNLFVFNKLTGEEKTLTTVEFSLVQTKLGKEDPWLNYEIRIDDQTGSFRRFREKQLPFWKRPFEKQPLEQDLLKVFQKPIEDWKGPSWNFFWYAVHNQRPISIITARGHHPLTLKKGISHLHKKGYVTQHPNYLSIYPVSYKPTRLLLGDSKYEWHASRLKQEAIKRSVEEAFRVYGQNAGHRFGMSDDDPVNLKLIKEAMVQLKQKYPENSFYVIDTHGGRLLKQEIFKDHTEDSEMDVKTQLSFFGE